MTFVQYALVYDDDNACYRRYHDSFRIEVQEYEDGLPRKGKSVAMNHSVTDHESCERNSKDENHKLDVWKFDTKASGHDQTSLSPSYNKQIFDQYCHSPIPLRSQALNTEPYTNPFTGKLVIPATASAAGPSKTSHTSEEAVTAQLERSKAIVESCTARPLHKPGIRSVHQQFGEQACESLQSCRTRTPILQQQSDLDVYADSKDWGKRSSRILGYSSNRISSQPLIDIQDSSSLEKSSPMPEMNLKRRSLSSIGLNACSRLKRLASRYWSVQKPQITKSDMKPSGTLRSSSPLSVGDSASRFDMKQLDGKRTLRTTKLTSTARETFENRRNSHHESPSSTSWQDVIQQSRVMGISGEQLVTSPSSSNGVAVIEKENPSIPRPISYKPFRHSVVSGNRGDISQSCRSAMMAEQCDDLGSEQVHSFPDAKTSTTRTALNRRGPSQIYQKTIHNDDDLFLRTEKEVLSCAYDHIFAQSLAENTPQDIGRFFEAQYELELSLQRDLQLAKHLSDEHSRVDLPLSTTNSRKPAKTGSYPILARKAPQQIIFVGSEEWLPDLDWQNPTNEQLDLLRLQAEWSVPNDQRSAAEQKYTWNEQSHGYPVNTGQDYKESQCAKLDAVRLMIALEGQMLQESSADQQARAARVEKARQAQLVNCVVCTETRHESLMRILVCKHAYDTACLVQAISINLKDRKLFTCCKRDIPVASVRNLLQGSSLAAYELLLLEKQTPNPVYCAKPNCGKFIPPSSVSGDKATCTTCSQITCRLCRALEHAGVCAQDNNGQRLLELATKQKWVTCPNCKAIVEKSAGCLHMTCRCSFEFCYNCTREWKLCKSTCDRGH